MRRYSPQQLAEYLQTNSPMLLDVREPWEYAICKLEGSTLVPMRQIPELAPQLDPQQEIVIICHHGIRSMAVCNYLEQQYDFSGLINLEGGVDAWARQLEPGMPTY